MDININKTTELFINLQDVENDAKEIIVAWVCEHLRHVHPLLPPDLGHERNHPQHHVGDGDKQGLHLQPGQYPV